MPNKTAVHSTSWSARVPGGREAIKKNSSLLEKTTKVTSGSVLESTSKNNEKFPFQHCTSCSAIFAQTQLNGGNDKSVPPHLWKDSPRCRLPCATVGMRASYTCPQESLLRSSFRRLRHAVLLAPMVNCCSTTHLCAYRTMRSLAGPRHSIKDIKFVSIFQCQPIFPRK